MTEALAAAPAPAPAEPMDEDTEAMAAVWRKHNAEEAEPAPAETPEEPPPAPEGEPKPEEPPAPTPPAEFPSDLPQALRDDWASIPEASRDKWLGHVRSLNGRMAEQGRVVSAAKPVYDVLVEMARANPTVANMPPAAIAQEVAAFYTGLQRDPARTLATIAQNYGALDGLKALLAGQHANPHAGQPAQPAQPDPRRLAAAIPAIVAQEVERRVQQIEVEQTANSIIDGLRPSMPLFEDVEAALPVYIEALNRTQPGLSPQDKLRLAYHSAIEARPDLKAKVQAAATPAPAQPDPARTDAQLRARSVNLPASRPTASPPQSEDDAYRAIWRRNHG